MRRQLLDQLRRRLDVLGAAGAPPAAAALARRRASAAAAGGGGGLPAASAAAAAASSAARPPAAPRGLRGLLRDYKQLSKARLSLLVTATSAAGFVAGSPEAVDWGAAAWTSAGTFLCAASANALNQAYEVATDARMGRTAARPLPAGRMRLPHALAFAAAAGAAGTAALATHANGAAAALGAANIALYAGVYTPLKQLSAANTWVGAAVGAVPPLLGWAAAAGSLDAGAALLAAGLYFWQLPHFMALAWLCRADYAAGGHRMLSLADAGGRRTAGCALRNCFYLFAVGPAAAWLGVTTPYFAYESALVTAGMTAAAAKFYGARTQANARLLFRASLLHLPLFMAAFLAHRRPNAGELDRLQLLRRNAAALGLPTWGGGSGEGDEDDEEEGAPLDARPDGVSAWGRGLGAVSFPPLPFLPLPAVGLAAPAAGGAAGGGGGCPSKAACEPAAAGQGRRSGGGAERRPPP